MESSSAWGLSLLHYSSTPLLQRLYIGDGDRRDSFTASDRSEPLVSRGLDAHAGFRDAKRGGELFAHRANVRSNFRRLGDKRRVHIHGARSSYFQHFGDAPQDLDAADAADGFISIREMLSDISGADRAKQRVGNRVR